MTENRAGAGRPKAHHLLKKEPVKVKLPRWLLDKMADKPENRAIQIEEALCKLNGWERPNSGE